MPRTYEVSLSEDGVVTKLGELVFDAENNTTLVLADKGPAFELLKERWDEIGERASLDVTRTRRKKQDDGSWLHYTVSENIAKESPDYPPAIVQYMGMNFGYQLSRQLAPAQE